MFASCFINPYTLDRVALVQQSDREESGSDLADTVSGVVLTVIATLASSITKVE